MSALFYAESLDVSVELAQRVSDFMDIANNSAAVLSPRPWAAHGKVRVYFEPWSQNSLRVFHLAEKWFYDAKEDDVFAEGFFWGCKHSKRLLDLASCSARNFSGAKTKARLVELAEVFYGQKANRG